MALIHWLFSVCITDLAAASRTIKAHVTSTGFTMLQKGTHRSKVYLEAELHHSQTKDIFPGHGAVLKSPNAGAVPKSIESGSPDHENASQSRDGRDNDLDKHERIRDKPSAISLALVHAGISNSDLHPDSRGAILFSCAGLAYNACYIHAALAQAKTSTQPFAGMLDIVKPVALMQLSVFLIGALLLALLRMPSQAVFGVAALSHWCNIPVKEAKLLVRTLEQITARDRASDLKLPPLPGSQHAPLASSVN